MSLWIDKHRPTRLDKLTYHLDQAKNLKSLVSAVSFLSFFKLVKLFSFFNIIISIYDYLLKLGITIQIIISGGGGDGGKGLQ